MTAGQQQQAAPRALAPEGRWRGKVTDHDICEAGTGNIQIAIGFAFNDADGKTWHLTFYKVVTPSTMGCRGGVVETLKALDFDLEKEKFQFEKLTRADLGGGALVGKEADITVEHEVQEKGERAGQKVAKIEWVNPVGGGLGVKERPADKAAVTSLASRMRAIMQSGAAPTPSARPGAQSGGAKSKLPFDHRAVA